MVYSQDIKNQCLVLKKRLWILSFLLPSKCLYIPVFRSFTRDTGESCSTLCSNVYLNYLNLKSSNRNSKRNLPPKKNQTQIIAFMFKAIFIALCNCIRASVEHGAYTAQTSCSPDQWLFWNVAVRHLLLHEAPAWSEETLPDLTGKKYVLFPWNISFEVWPIFNFQKGSPGSALPPPLCTLAVTS